MLRGCTDPEALNYDPEAKESNNTCIYSNISSEIIVVRENDWVSLGADGYRATKEMSSITSEILETGLVASYLIFDDSHLQMPASIFVAEFGGYTEHYVFSLSEGEIVFLVQDDDGLTPNPGRLEFKVVIIEDQSAAIEMNLDLENYVEVSTKLNLE